MEKPRSPIELLDNTPQEKQKMPAGSCPTDTGDTTGLGHPLPIFATILPSARGQSIIVPGVHAIAYS
jgi:hypothetical protein